MKNNSVSYFLLLICVIRYLKYYILYLKQYFLTDHQLFYDITKLVEELRSY